MTQTPSRDWQKDMEMCEHFADGHIPGGPLDNGKAVYTYGLMAKEALPYWLQEAKERGEREQRLKETMERLKKITDEEAEAKHHTMTIALRKKIIDQALSTLYPDTPAKPVDIGTEKWDTARPIDEWHEDIGPVLWWTFPIEELPYCGTPLDGEWPGYHTHWAPFIIPFTPAPAAPKEGTPDESID